MASVHHYNYALLSRSGIDYILRDLSNIITQLVPDTEVQTFQKLQIDDIEDCIVWKPHVVKRHLSGNNVSAHLIGNII